MEFNSICWKSIIFPCGMSCTLGNFVCSWFTRLELRYYPVLSVLPVSIPTLMHVFISLNWSLPAHAWTTFLFLLTFVIHDNTVFHLFGTRKILTLCKIIIWVNVLLAPNRRFKSMNYSRNLRILVWLRLLHVNIAWWKHCLIFFFFLTYK